MAAGSPAGVGADPELGAPVSHGAPPRPELNAVALALRNGLARRQGGQGAAPPPPATAPAAAPAAKSVGAAAVAVPEQDDSLEGIAQEARDLIQDALEHGGIQRDSVRGVLACHAIMVQLLPAHAQRMDDTADRIEELLREAREPMSAEDKAAWKAEFMAAVTAALGKLEAVHQQAAKQAVAAVQAEAARMVRATDKLAVQRAGRGYVVALAVGLLLGGATVWGVISRDVTVTGAGLALQLDAAKDWLAIIRENPRPALRDDQLRDAQGGGQYWDGVALWKTRPRPGR